MYQSREAFLSDCADLPWRISIERSACSFLTPEKLLYTDTRRFLYWNMPRRLDVF
jgi:hypothetical protein